MDQEQSWRFLTLRFADALDGAIPSDYTVPLEPNIVLDDVRGSVWQAALISVTGTLPRDGDMLVYSSIVRPMYVGNVQARFMGRLPTFLEPIFRPPPEIGRVPTINMPTPYMWVEIDPQRIATIEMQCTDEDGNVPATNLSDPEPYPTYVIAIRQLRLTRS